VSAFAPLLRLAIVGLLLSSCIDPGGGAPERTTQVLVVPSPTAVAVVTVTPATAAPTVAGTTAAPTRAPQTLTVTEFKVGPGQGPHDVAPAADGGIWYTAQRTGELGWLDPQSGEFQMTKLGAGSAPHGVIVGRDGNAYVTDGGLNAIVRVDAKTKKVTTWPLPAGRGNANLNTASFDSDGTLWFTGQSGIFGRLDTRSGEMAVFDSPRGAGPYGIASCPDGELYYASLAASFVGQITRSTGTASVLAPPTSDQGSRRVWCDSLANVWVSEWNAGKVGRYDRTTRQWTEWKLPGANPMAYAVYVDEQDIVWLTDFGANALVRFDPKTATFTSLPHAAPNAAVRQLLGRPGEVWGAMSGQDKLLVVRTR
jgi:virginiamycin B lyase